MSDEIKRDDAPEAPAESAEEKRGLFGRKRKKLTMKEQIREIMPLVYVLIIGGIGYAVYWAVTYNWAPTFELEDQRANVHTIDFTGDKPLVIAFSDRESGSQLQAWTLQLMGAYGDRIEAHRVVDFSRLAPAFRTAGRGLLSRIPVAVMIDYEGTVAAQYGFEGGDAALFVISPGGTIKERVYGEMNDEKWTRVKAALDALLARDS